MLQLTLTETTVDQAVDSFKVPLRGESPIPCFNTRSRQGKVSIKKSGPAYAPSIEEIRAAASAQGETQNLQIARSEKLEKSAAEYSALLDQALSREMSLVLEVFQLKRQITEILAKIFHR